MISLNTLTAVMARQGTSGDETVRRRLAEHVELQEGKDPEDRLARFFVHLAVLGGKGLHPRRSK
ncbi:hypothetical protein ACWGDS_34405 [Streptomyces sp. NPDC055059]|uniref:hypothetical protein n=2 Tax=Streptomyces TaxID=1883 RepID=UPI0033ACCA60